jgi:hypothetical protein
MVVAVSMRVIISNDGANNDDGVSTCSHCHPVMVVLLGDQRSRDAMLVDWL